MIRCGHLLRDEGLVEKAKRHLDYVLENQNPQGYLGPAHMQSSAAEGTAGWVRWPHTIFFRALIGHHSATRDERIVPALARHYLSSTASHGNGRDVTNVETILWTYAQTGDRRLLAHAVEAFAEYNRLSPGDDTALVNLLSEKRGTEHGVTFNEIGKLGAILYNYTGEQRYLEATVNAYRKLDRDQMLVDGVPSSSEKLRGKDPLDSHETCDIADYAWSVGYLLLATGEAEYADKIERACFNAAPGAVRSDFKGLQYLSCPNQVLADATSNHNHFYRGAAWMSYRPNPGTECCPGEVNRIMPNYVSRMWLSDGNGGLVAALYGASRVTAQVGAEEQEVTIIQKTNYPFSERIDFKILAESPVEFTLTLRIPGWCQNPSVRLNGETLDLIMSPGRFVKLERPFNHGDQVSLQLPMEIQVAHWPRGGVSVERGPLVYALRIEEDWQVDERDERSTPEFPAWNLYPASAWNYALVEEGFAEAVEIMQRDFSVEPWSIAAAPIELRVPARRVPGWVLDRRNAIISERWIDGVFGDWEYEGKFVFTPQLPEVEGPLGEVEMVTLVPYGCAKLRIAVFPSG